MRNPTIAFFTMITSITCTLADEHEIISRSKILVTNDVDLSSPMFGSSVPGRRDCVHCKSNECYGHIGHIKLPIYLCNPLLQDTINNTLSNTCLKCHITYPNKLRNCNKCGNIINNVTIDTIGPDKARQHLINTGSYLSRAFTSTVAVIPRMMRPKDISTNSEYSITNSYIKLLESCNSKKLQYKHLSTEFTNLITSTTNKYNTKSITTILKGKDGLFRQHMVGKRVDNCGRAVIIGTDLQDVNIVSLPITIYNKLRISVTATIDNLNHLHILSSMGKLYNKRGELVHIPSIKLGKTYKRTLYGNDRILLNRQPSLSKYSIMSFKVEYNYSNAMIINTAITNAYAADFDGDEMNVFLQDNDGFILDTNSNLALEHNPECLSLIQDVVTSYYALTKYPKHVTKDQYCTSCMICNRYDIPYHNNFNTRDLLSLPLPNSLIYSTNNVNIINGTIISGYITKSDLNKIMQLVTISGYSIVTYIKYTQSLISNLTSNIYGISIGLDDIDIVDKPYIDNVISIYDNINNPTYNELDIISNNLSNICSNIVVTNIKDSSLYNMILSGAKGNIDNIVHMSISLGYQRIEGKLSDRCKSSFLYGLTEQEYIYHQRSSREGLVRTNVYTADVGYADRKLCKALSNTRYTNGVIKDNDNIIYQGPLLTNINIDNNILHNLF